MRKTWNEYFMDVAELVSTRSTCDRLHVGAVIVQDKNIIATGYNGSPKGMPHCDEVGHEMENGHCVRTTHAEQNALIQAAKHGHKTNESTLYITHSPCYTCAKLIITAGIKNVYFKNLFRESKGIDLLTKSNVYWELVGNEKNQPQKNSHQTHKQKHYNKQ